MHFIEVKVIFFSVGGQFSEEFAPEWASQKGL